MKKFLALALVVAFAIAMMPATLAAPAAKADVKLNGSEAIDRPFTNTAIDQNGNVLNTSELRGANNRKVQKTSNEVNPKYLETETFATNASTGDVKLMGFELIDPEIVHTNGYWLTKADGDFTAVNDFYVNQENDVYLHKFTAATEEGNRLMAEGETIFMNYDLYQSFSESEGFVELPENEDGYDISVIVVGGVMAADGTIADASIAGEYTALNAISLQFTAPADDFVYVFYVVIDEVDTLTGDFGAWIEFSSMEATIDNIPQGADMKVGEYATTEVGTSSTMAAVLPMGTMYRPAYADAHKIELVGGEHYVLHVESTTNIGARVMFADENFDVIADTWISGAALEHGYTYDEIDMNVWPAVSGSYYIVVAGYSMVDEGALDVLVDLRSNFGEYEQINDQNVAINLNDLGTETFLSEDETWGFIWDAEAQVGELLLAYPGTYTITGDNSNVVIDAYDGVKVVLDNSVSGGVLALNGFASVAIEAKGSAKIYDAIIGQAISNVYGNNAGAYIVGEQLTIEGELFGIVFEDAPVHIATKKLIVDTKSAEGYYPIAIWVIGAKLAELTFGGEATFNGANQKATMFYDTQEAFAFGYTVSDQASLYETEEPQWDKAVLGFELTTNGSIGGGNYMIGDANGDGKVNTGDATMILKYVAELVTLEGTNLQAADMNQDGKVNTGDATAILKFVVGQ